MKLLIALIIVVILVIITVMSLFRVSKGLNPDKNGIQKQLDDEQAQIIAEMMKKKKEKR